MNLRTYFLLSVAAFFAFSCNDQRENDHKVVEGVPTYATLSIDIADLSKDVKALPEDYNPDGEYEGNDGVQTLDIYMLSADGTIEAQRFTGSQISSNGTNITTSQPFRTTSGTKTVYIVVNDPLPLATTITSEQELVSIAGLARIVTSGGVDYDVIVMTGRATGVVIDPDISPSAVLLGSNIVEVSVNRVASRVIVTTTAPMTVSNNGVTIGTLSNMTYSVAQGASQIYWIEQPDYVSYGYDYVPALGEYYGGAATTFYDYSDLSSPSPVPALPAAADGYKELQGKFLFENTHVYGSTRATTGYRKGNTAYVLVKVVFTPDPTAIADGGQLTNGTFYVGESDGLIYSSRDAAELAVQNQKTAGYLGGEVLYYAWLNPDNIETPLNSPVVRNNIYHINITSFGSIGYNWNPLYPEPPGSTLPPNPDPKPDNPNEPDSPIDPIDPLTPEQTFMNVDVTVIPWTVHSYDIDF